MAHPTYCNITTDLTDVYSQIEEYASTRFSIKAFSIHSSSANIYKSYDSGEVEELFEDSVRLTEVSAIASINAASKWYYDSTNDILYVRSSDDADPDTHEIEKGIDWNTFKTRMRDRAQDEIDSLLDHRFPRPIPQARQYHATNLKYDVGLVKATALQTCVNILNAFAEFDTTNELRKQITEPEFKSGIIDKYNNREMRFSWETTPDELAHYNIEAATANTGDGFIELSGRYGGDTEDDDHLTLFDMEDEVWHIEIDSAGAVGTATFKWSRDDGTTFQATTKTTNYEWIALDAGVYIRFWDRDGEFDSGDKWKCYMTTDRREDIVQPPTIILRG